MKLIKDQEFGGERPLYASHNLRLQHVTIHPGESAIKESSDIEAEDCTFDGKYVLWETDGIKVNNCHFTQNARSSLWYSRGLHMTNCQVEAPKLFRRMDGIHIENTNFPNGEQYLWDCKNIHLKNVRIDNCDYAFMHSQNIHIDNYHQEGNYAFQYAKNVEIHHALINSKDSFWESENITIYDSLLNGEYLAWYGKNIRLVRCHLTGEQLLCYVNGLILEDCTFGTDANLILEYTTVSGTIRGNVHSIRNPTSGTIIVEGTVGELIWDQNQKAPANAKVICNL